MGIGTNTPDEKLHVVGKIKMEDGNAQAGYVLTSDANGVGTWQANVDTDTDDQTLSFDGTNISIADGNSIDISSIDTDTDTDDQTLSFDGTNISITDGNSIDISSVDTDTDNQTLTYNNTNKSLSISGGNTADLTQLAVPVGTIIMWIGDENETVPAGWLVCDNRIYNTTTYPDLFALLGANRTPNFLGRFPVGAPRDGIGGATGISVGGTGGEEDKTLSVANLPPHSHEIKFREGDESGNNNDYSDINAPNNEKNATGSTESTGDGQSFKIMPPFLGVQFLIKAE